MGLKRISSAIWNGSGLKGSGKLTSTSGALKDLPYTHYARFVSEDGKAGTNPEELIAAAHAGCFSMALSFQLDGAGFTATEIKTKATVSLGSEGVHFFIAGVHLDLEAIVPGISNEKFQELAENAKKGCPVSKALAAVTITMTAKLKP